MAIGANTVAKKAGRPPKRSVSDAGPALIAIQVTPEYKAWYEAIAAALRTTNSGAFDRIVAEWAADNGHPPPPSRT